MCVYTERTQVLLSPEQRRRLEGAARHRGVALGVVIREAIDAHIAAGTRTPAEALHALFSLEAPVSDWTTMKREILRGADG
jgi:hypothetical protein